MEDQKLRETIRDMELETTRVLDKDASMQEALCELQRKIIADPEVNSIREELLTLGYASFISFNPRPRIHVNTDTDTVKLPKPNSQPLPQPDQVGTLTQALRAAIGSWLRENPQKEITTILNEAVGASTIFDQLRAPIDKAKYLIFIKLDLSSCVEVGKSEVLPLLFGKTEVDPERVAIADKDVKFLKSVGIKTD